jgi:hypothetical protein
MPTPSTSVINENCRREIISKKHDLSRKRITISHGTYPSQVFRVARKLGIECINLHYNASARTVKMVVASSSDMGNKLPIMTAS